MKIKRIHILLIVLGIAIATIPFRAQVRRPVVAVVQILKGRKTVTDRLAEFGPAARRRLAPDFKRTGVSYPPKQLIFVGLKQEKHLRSGHLLRSNCSKHIQFSEQAERSGLSYGKEIYKSPKVYTKLNLSTRTVCIIWRFAWITPTLSTKPGGKPTVGKILAATL